MLTVKDLVKIYKPKKGVPVCALNKVSLTLPEKGMVFLLGKSGSGKSTLLNIMGGLDRYNSGDILVMGNSTKKWNQSHFDSYRNTYVGFIFQEYNILNEFSVGANIAMAIQLQGKKPTSEQVNDILKAVDLEGYGNRNPNELSGGQKQRVAIARALVKNPKIIMADEPTGALDSTTGRQVLNTLKKLSIDKLVIVVSHDREFAEQYADRIVELADGKIIHDVERQSFGGVDSSVPVYMPDSVSLPEEYVLTEEDKAAICDYIQKMISTGKQPKFSLFSRRSTSFQPTDEKNIPTSKSEYKLIKSRLPLKYAFKLGASGLKHKKFRLVMTILLSCIALGLFGLSDTLASYSYRKTAFSSLSDPESNVTYAAFEKEYYSEGEWSEFSHYLSNEDLERIEEETGLNARPVYEGYFSLHNNLGDLSDSSPYDIPYYLTNFAGSIVISDELLEDMGAKLSAGRLPESAFEVVVSSEILETFKHFGYADYNSATGEYKTTKIKSAEDLLGLSLSLDNTYVDICGVIDSGLDFERYEKLSDPDILYEDMSFVESIAIQALTRELDYVRRYSLSGLLMVSQDFIDNTDNLEILQYISSYTSVSTSKGEIENYPELYFATDYLFENATWLDGKKRTELAANEIVVGFNQLADIVYVMHDHNAPEEYDPYYIRDNGLSYSTIKDINISLFVDNELKQILPSEINLSSVIGKHNMKIVGFTNDSGYYVSPSFAPVSFPAPIIQTLSPMPTAPDELEAIIDFSAREFGPDKDTVLNYNLMNPVTFELKNLDEAFIVMRKVFFWVGLLFVVFSSLLFSNFIATSISYKKEQIGILRAIGSRGNDVFRIFFAESFIIAMINFILSFSGTIVVCAIINSVIKNSVGLLLTILNVGIRQAFLIFAICLLCAFAASYLPVRKIASKRPIDAIRDR